MSTNDIHAAARAQQDFVDGLSWDDNPFPVGSREAVCWYLEMDQLMIDESVRELSAA